MPATAPMQPRACWTIWNRVGSAGPFANAIVCVDVNIVDGRGELENA